MASRPGPATSSLPNEAYSKERMHTSIFELMISIAVLGEPYVHSRVPPACLGFQISDLSQTAVGLQFNQVSTDKSALLPGFLLARVWLIVEMIVVVRLSVEQPGLPSLLGLCRPRRLLGARHGPGTRTHACNWRPCRAPERLNVDKIA